MTDIEIFKMLDEIYANSWSVPCPHNPDVLWLNPEANQALDELDRKYGKQFGDEPGAMLECYSYFNWLEEQDKKLPLRPFQV
jgi:hypothetical protein